MLIWYRYDSICIPARSKGVPIKPWSLKGWWQTPCNGTMFQAPCNGSQPGRKSTKSTRVMFHLGKDSSSKKSTFEKINPQLTTVVSTFWKGKREKKATFQLFRELFRQTFFKGVLPGKLTTRCYFGFRDPFRSSPKERIARSFVVSKRRDANSPGPMPSYEFLIRGLTV